MDTLLPKPGDFLLYIGSKFNMTVGRHYSILRKDYSVITAYAVCVLDDTGIECWLDLIEFSLIE
jgi:hypothetical protein